MKKLKKKNIVTFTILTISCVLICYGVFLYHKNYQRNLSIEKTKHVVNQTIKASNNIHKEVKIVCNTIKIEQLISNIANSVHYQIDSINSIKETIIKEITNSFPENNPQETYAGSFSITAYTWTGSPMANGEYPYVGCAASSDFPIGTTIYIENIGTYVIKDICPTSGVIDLYMDTYDECINFGRRTANVYVI